MRWAIASSTGIVEKYPENAIALVMRRAWVASHNARIMLGSIRPGIGTQN
jgi:hypothetical protein